MRVLTLTSLLLLSLLSFPATAGIPAIKVLAYPKLVVSAPLERLNIEIQIARHRDNRAYCVEVDGPDLFSGTCEQLSGAGDKVIHSTFVLHLDHDGKYVIRAMLFRVDPGPEKAYTVVSTTVYVGVQQASLVGESLIAP